MLVSYRTILCNIARHSINPGVYGFLTTQCLIFPQPYNLVEIMLLNFSVIQENFQILYIVCGTEIICSNYTTTYGSSSLCTIYTQIIQNVNPIVVRCIRSKISTDINH